MSATAKPVNKKHGLLGLSGRSVRVGSIGNVRVSLDWSLIIVFAFITIALSVGPLPSWHPDWNLLTTVLTAVAAAVLFLASVLAHELSHALVGRRVGIDVRHITLFVFGGMAHMENEPRGWRGELAMAIAGPAASLVLGVAFFYLGMLAVGPGGMVPDDPLATLSSSGPIATILFWLGPVNILLAVFNMVPGFPLDGGRVLRAILWGATGDVLRATRWAATAGQGFAWLLIMSGLAMMIGIDVPLLGSGLIGGLWVALVGWFLNKAAVISYRRLIVHEGLGDLPVTDLMHTDFEPVAPTMTVRDFIDHRLLGSEERVFPVIEDGQLQGLVCLADVRQVDWERHDSTRLAEIMTPTRHLTMLPAMAQARDALRRLTERHVNQIPVVDDGRLLGLVTREDILRWLTSPRSVSDEADTGLEDRA